MNREPKFNIGDTVRVRQWDDMAAEYGEGEFSINTPGASFVDEMKYLCGEEYKITNLHGLIGKTFQYRFVGDDGYIVTEEMLEPASASPEIEPCTTEELFEFLGIGG